MIAQALCIERPYDGGSRRVVGEIVGPAGTAAVAVVAIHGGPGFTAATLRTGMDALARHLPVASFDLPGCGRSSRHVGSGYPLDAFADDVAAVIDAVSASTHGARIVLLAHAWGAILATAYARRDDARVAALVLMNPLRILNDGGQDGDAQHRRVEAIDPSLVPRFRALAPVYARAMEGDDTAWDEIDANPWSREMFATQFAGPVPDAWRRAVDAAGSGGESYGAYKGRAFTDPESEWAHFDLATWAASVALPVLVIASDDDANYVAPPDLHARPLSTAFPDAELVVIDGLGHFPFAEAPDDVADRVGQWIAKRIR